MSRTKICHRNTSTLSNIYSHPFNQAIYSGTLPFDRFKLYLELDGPYLRNYSSSLKKTAERLRLPWHRQLFMEAARDVIASEQDMQSKYLKPLGFFNLNTQEATNASNLRTKAQSVISEYGNYLSTMAEKASVEEAVAGHVICFYVYMCLGKQMPVSQLKPNHPYKNWIQTYSDSSFIESTKLMMRMSDELNKNLCEQQLNRVWRAFDRAVEYEYAFFDSLFPNRPQSKMADTRMVRETKDCSAFRL